MTSDVGGHILVEEPALSFNRDHAADIDIHPLLGLLRYGPHSKGLVPDPIRVATLSPSGMSGRLYHFMRELNGAYTPGERRDYLPDWPGFQRVFGAHMRAAGGRCHVEIDAQIDSELRGSARPHLVLAERLTRAIHSLEAQRDAFDVLFVCIPRAWDSACRGDPWDDFDLHDHLKAITASRRLPLQIVREDSALEYADRASVMWRIGLALYAKAGGVPWKIAGADSDIAYIGLSYALRPSDSDQPRFVTCCSQVFDAEGSGLEFVAYDAREVEVRGDNPFLSRNEMFRVMSRSLDLYRRRHAGSTPRRVMVHKTTEFKRDEIEGLMQALHLCEAVDLVQIVESVGWRGVRVNRRQGSSRGAPASFPVQRGTLVGLSPFEALLWVHGDVRGIGSRGSYFQGGRSTPRPLRLVRHAGHGSWDDTCRAILGLSKMNWNNDALYDQVPVTIGFSRILSRVVKRMPLLGSAPYQFRFFM